MAISKIETDSLASGLVAPTATALTTASGSAPSYSARAWVNFDGTGTPAIRASGNVSSITDNGTGDYTANFTTAMPDVNYAISVASRNLTTNTSVSNNSNTAGAQTTSAVRVNHLEAAASTDTDFMHIIIFR